MKHYRDEGDTGATFTNMEQAFHYHPWEHVLKL